MAGKKVDPQWRLLRHTTAMPNGCWYWRGHRAANGYGTMHLHWPDGSHDRYAHRVAYRLFRGPIPDGLCLDHLCRTRHCVNPTHLEAVTLGENLRRGAGPTLTRARYVDRTHCRRGHLLTPPTTIVRLVHGALVRACRLCKNQQRNLRRRERWRTDPAYRDRECAALRHRYRQRTQRA